jgi:hypothetical protein
MSDNDHKSHGHALAWIGQVLDAGWASKVIDFLAEDVARNLEPFPEHLRQHNEDLVARLRYAADCIERNDSRVIACALSVVYVPEDRPGTVAVESTATGQYTGVAAAVTALVAQSDETLCQAYTEFRDAARATVDRALADLGLGDAESFLQTAHTIVRAADDKLH